MKKAQIKALKKLAKMLPISIEHKENGQFVKGSALSESARQSAIENHGSIDSAKYYGTEKRGFVEIDHVSRLKKAWSRNKEQGLVDYIQWVDLNNIKRNKIYKSLKLENVSKEL